MLTLELKSQGLGLGCGSQGTSVLKALSQKCTGKSRHEAEESYEEDEVKGCKGLIPLTKHYPVTFA